MNNETTQMKTKGQIFKQNKYKLRFKNKRGYCKEIMKRN